MKKEQKRLGNKGFSLVELIVVIAIMAILVAVLAPTLLSKIEDSREATDLQAMGELNSAMKTALAKEKVNDEMKADGNYTVDISSGVPKITAGPAGSGTFTEVNKELAEIIPEIKFKSKKATASGVKVIITINSGKVTTALYESNGTTKVQNSDDEDFEVK